MRIGFILMLCLLTGSVSIAQSQPAQDLVYKDWEVVITEDNGLQGLGLKGSINANRDSEEHYNLMHMRCEVVVSDTSGAELFRSEERYIREFYSWRFYPNHAAMARKGSRSEGSDNVVFVPFTILSTSAGHQTLKVHLEVTDVFEKDWREKSPEVRVEVNIPEKIPVWVEINGMTIVDQPGAKKMPEDAVLFVSDGLEKLTLNQGSLAGWLNFSKGDRLQLGLTSQKVGHTSGFRLFKIQITRGHDYTYTSELDVKFFDLDSLMRNVPVEIPVRFESNEETPAFTTRLTLLDRKTRLEQINPAESGRPIVLGSDLPNRSGKSGFTQLSVPLRCIESPSDRTDFYAELWVGEEKVRKSGMYSFNCLDLVRTDFALFDELGESPAFLGGITSGELETTPEGQYWNWFVSYKFLEDRIKEIDTLNNPIVVKFLSSGGPLGSTSPEVLWEGTIHAKEIDTWRKEKTMTLIIIIASIVGVLSIGVYLLVKMINDRKKKQLTDFRIG